jgi:2-C-methyl-D-erythritol 4-phosphate cytidylyltransferase
MKTIAIILAGGSGRRLGADIPKQFIKVNDKMIIEYTIEAFQNHAAIDEIAVVCHADYTPLINESISNRGYDKVTKVLKGGDERFHSSVTAIQAYDDQQQKKILFHDGVRPLVSDKIISDCIAKLDVYNAIGVGIETTDTIWSVSNGHIINIPDRRSIYRAQTPQGFKFFTIQKAYNMALQDKKMATTDDCGVVMNYLSDEKIGTVMGEEQNLKITQKDDLLHFENFLNGEEWNK